MTLLAKCRVQIVLAKVTVDGGWERTSKIPKLLIIRLLDATRAFVTGDFTEAGLIDDVSGLSHQDILGIQEWSNFYEKEYKLVGLLQGTYYDAEGHLTELIGLIEDAKLWKAAQTKEAEVFPPCNSEWHKDSGGRVWCLS
uniref:Uncharacterized protein n=1 Tax=Parascaris equorum TaxID=6256 RepID=A0A914R6A4_PAREQ